MSSSCEQFRSVHNDGRAVERATSMQQADDDIVDELSLSERHSAVLESWFKHSPSFIVVVRGPRHIVEMANDAYFDLIGPRDLIGKPLFDVLTDVRGQGFEILLNDVFTSGDPYVGRDARVLLQRRPSALPVEMFLDFVFQPMRDDTGLVTGICIQGHDMTFRRIAMQELRDADRSKDDFLAMLAHELRNPLSPIKTSIAILKKIMVSADPRQLKLITVIERQTEQISALVDDLMDVASVRSGKVELDLASISIQDCIALALESSQSMIDMRRHRLDVALPEELLMVYCDPRRLAQVISNLVNNAAKYTPTGGVIAVIAESVDSQVRVRVIDKGMGITPTVLPRVFEMFLQAPEATRRAHGGLGIGLALVKKIIDLHGGTVSAKSDGRDLGSEFTVSLPRVDETPSAEAIQSEQMLFAKSHSGCDISRI